jgi:hypothetical protein
MQTTAIICSYGSTHGFGAARPARVYPDIGDDPAAGYRRLIKNLRNRTMRANDGRSLDRGQAHRDCDSLDVQISPKREKLVGSFGLRAVQEAARVLRRRQPMLNRNSRVYHFRFHQRRADASVTSIPALDIASQRGVRERQRVGAVV